MILHLLAYDGEELDCSMDVPPEKWARDYRIDELEAVGIDADHPERILFQLEIITAIQKIVNMDDDVPLDIKGEALTDLMHKCRFFWITGVLEDFEEKSATHDGFVKVFDDHVEWGWMERRDPRKLN